MVIMAEYIEREAGVKIAEKYGLANGCVLGRHTGLADCIASEIVAIPPADVAPVVRCKHCKYFRGYGKTSLFIDGKNVEAGWCERRIRYDEECRMLPDDFCSYGTAMGGNT